MGEASAMLLDRDRAALVVVDLQEAYRAALHDYERVAGAVARLVQGAAIFGVPVLVTEQYPKGLGHTVPEVAAHLPADVTPISKLTLSCCGTPAFMTALSGCGRSQVVVAGAETHACVSQTAHDLLAAGYQVHVPRDATSSRRPEDRDVAWEKLVQRGVVPTTVEAALLELLRTAAAPEFKALQRVIK